MNCTVHSELVGKGGGAVDVYGVKICEQVLTTDGYTVLG